MDTFRSCPHTHTPPPSAAVEPPKVLDALCALCAPHDHQLDALPDLLDVFAGKKLLNKELTGQLYSTAQQVPSLSSPFAHALDASDPTDRAVAFAITGRVRNLLVGMNDGSGPIRSRRSSATSTRSRRDSLASFSPVLASNTLRLDAEPDEDAPSPTAGEGAPPAKAV